MSNPQSTLPGHIVSGYQSEDPPPTGTPEYNEWLIDVAVEHTFPASDPPSTMSPGNKESRDRKIADTPDAGECKTNTIKREH